MDIRSFTKYFPRMIVSRSDQARFVRFLEKVGGYDEVLRLNREFRRVKAAGHKPMIVRDEVTKKYSVTAAFLQNELNEIGVVSGRPVCRKEQPGAQLSPMRDAREAELFLVDGSQAVMIPADFEFAGSRVFIRKEGNRLVIEPKS